MLKKSAFPNDSSVYIIYIRNKMKMFPEIKRQKSESLWRAGFEIMYSNGIK
jgi:hypothetical protein